LENGQIYTHIQNHIRECYFGIYLIDHLLSKSEVVRWSLNFYLFTKCSIIERM